MEMIILRLEKVDFIVWSEPFEPQMFWAIVLDGRTTEQ